MKSANKLSLSVLSLLMTTGLMACSNSKDDQGSLIPTAEETLAEPSTSLEVSLERLVSTEEVDGQVVESYSRKYTLTEEGEQSTATFQDGTEKYGNINLRTEGTEYVINDMCTSSECEMVISLVSKVTEEGVQQDSYLYKIEDNKYVLVCKQQDTRFEQQEEALDALTSTCKESNTQSQSPEQDSTTPADSI